MSERERDEEPKPRSLLEKELRLLLFAGAILVWMFGCLMAIDVLGPIFGGPTFLFLPALVVGSLFLALQPSFTTTEQWRRRMVWIRVAVVLLGIPWLALWPMKPWDRDNELAKAAMMQFMSATCEKDGERLTAFVGRDGPSLVEILETFGEFHELSQTQICEKEELHFLPRRPTGEFGYAEQDWYCLRYDTYLYVCLNSEGSEDASRFKVAAFDRLTR